MLRTLPAFIAIVCLAFGMWPHSFAEAGIIRDRIAAYRAQQAQGVGSQTALSQSSLPTGARLLRDVSYGNDSQQRMDVYLPAETHNAPAIFMVHGGGWKRGDKQADSVVDNKMARWVSRGVIFISVNYRMLPEADPQVQVQDIVSALVAAQRKAASWGGDPARFILMGHSAGAHLVAFLAANPAEALSSGAQLWLGTVALDSAAYDIEQIMQSRHFGLYDDAFGSDPAYWRKLSPYHVLTANGQPLLAVCSSRRSESCQQAQHFAGKARSMNMRVVVLKQDVTHKQINQLLGTDGSYTEAVESFMGSLDDSVKQALAQ